MPYLAKFIEVDSTNSIQFKIGQIFQKTKNKLESGYGLREIIESVESLKFQSSAEKHELSHLYESRIRRMGNAGRNGGEYYTPRPLIRAIVEVVAPKIGETVYDCAPVSTELGDTPTEYVDYIAQVIRDTIDGHPLFRPLRRLYRNLANAAVEAEIEIPATNVYSGSRWFCRMSGDTATFHKKSTTNPLGNAE